MLLSLAVRDFVLIDGLTLELGEGLHVLSGETGAGKSILVDALSLVLGGRARPEVVRTGRDAAEVEALFDVRDDAALARKLDEEGLPPAEDGELVIRRSVASTGRSKAWINGRLVTAAQLAGIARGLCDVSSQHESQTLCDASTHGELLDAYGNLAPLREAVANEVAAALAIAREIQSRKERIETLRAREDFLRFSLTEIDELALRAGEEQELEALRMRLRHADRLSGATRRAAARLDAEAGGDEGPALIDGLRRALADVESAGELDPALAVHARTMESAIVELEEVARALGRYAEEVDADPEKLGEIEERLFAIARITRKHGPTIDDVLKKREEIAAELAGLDGVDESLEALATQRKELLGRAVERARKLSAARQKAAKSLGDAIAKELSTLAMGRARIVVEVAPIPHGASAEAEDDAFAVPLDEGVTARLTKNGIDRIELMIAPNPGEDPRPLRRIASGGELSRALLAVKRVLAASAPAGLYVFDEVDAGVGGAVAETIGRKIADVAAHHQVLCITHLPQIAAFADVHFSVAKRELDGRTVTEVKKLEGKARIEELARMLGGATITKTTRAAAEEMLKASRGKG